MPIAMKRVKAVRVNEPEPGGGRRRHCFLRIIPQARPVCAASPSVSVCGYSRCNETYAKLHVRTPANYTVKDELARAKRLDDVVTDKFSAHLTSQA